MAFSILPGSGLRIATHSPAPPLRAHIESYWSLTVEAPPATVHVLPDGLVDIIFDLSRRAVFVSGPLDEAAAFTHREPAELLGVSLRPGTAPALLGVSAAALAPSWQPLAGVIGEVAASIGALVWEAPSLRDRLALIDAFLLARMFATASEPRIRRAIDEIVASDGAADLEAVGRAAGASPRNLGRLFDDWVGLPPKRFARIVRLQAAMRRLYDEPTIPLATLAQEAGYSDQSHLTRELQALAGLSPAELARSLSDSFKK
jgi:AraC-like DNA-binding protein